MIKINIPKEPRKEDFGTSDETAQIAEAHMTGAAVKHKSYKKKNEKISWWLSCAITCIIAGVVAYSINPRLSVIGIVFCAIVFGRIGMFPIGFLLSSIFDNLGAAIEPRRTPKNEVLKRATSYLIALEQYKEKIKMLSIKYPELDNAQYDVRLYNALCVQKVSEMVDSMLKQVRIRSLSNTYLHIDRILNNLDMIGCEFLGKINSMYQIYKVKRGTEECALTLIENLSVNKLSIFCNVMQRINTSKGILITQNTVISNNEISIILKCHNIELISLSEFEGAALRVLVSEDLENRKAEEIPFENEHRICSRYHGNNTRIFDIRIITEVFEKRSELFEIIKSAPKTKGMYGVFPIFKSNVTSFWGLVYFQWEDEFDYYREWFTHAINDYRKEISRIVQNSGTWDPHTRFSYQCWSNLERDST